MDSPDSPRFPASVVAQANFSPLFSSMPLFRLLSFSPCLKLWLVSRAIIDHIGQLHRSTSSLYQVRSQEKESEHRIPVKSLIDDGTMNGPSTGSAEPTFGKSCKRYPVGWTPNPARID